MRIHCSGSRDTSGLLSSCSAPQFRSSPGGEREGETKARGWPSCVCVGGDQQRKGTKQAAGCLRQINTHNIPTSQSALLCSAACCRASTCRAPDSCDNTHTHKHVSSLANSTGHLPPSVIHDGHRASASGGGPSIIYSALMWMVLSPHGSGDAVSNDDTRMKTLRDTHARWCLPRGWSGAFGKSSGFT